MTLDDIVQAIHDGDADDGLEVVNQAIRDRAKMLASRKRLGMRPGDRVRFNAHANPKYLQGVGATVAALNPSTIVVDVDTTPRARRFSGARSVKCPANIVDKVASELAAGIAEAAREGAR